MESLYERGWRQGSLLNAALRLCSTVLLEGAMVHDSHIHREWVVVTQDCDLDRADLDEPEAIIELRPVLRDSPPQDVGIRSAKFLLTKAPPRYLEASTPRSHIAPAALTALLDGGAVREDVLDEVQQMALKTWLGKRYDRPAVPPQVLGLANSIAQEVAAHRSGAEPVRDVLMQFDTTTEPPRFSLYAVLSEGADPDVVREWLAEVALHVPPNLGIGDEFERGLPVGFRWH